MLTEEVLAWIKILVSVSGTLGLGYGVRYFVRSVSRASVETARDRAEVDVIKILREENKQLRESEALAVKERNQAVSKMSALETEVVLLNRAVVKLERKIEQLNARIETLLLK